MKNCAIYSSYSDIDKVFYIINDLYKGAKIIIHNNKTKIEVIEKKLFKKTTNSFNIMTSKTEKEKFANMISGMYNFFSQIPANNCELQEKLLVKITTLDMVIGVVTEKDISEKLFSEILTIAKKLDGVVFGTRELFNYDGKLLLDADGNSEVEDYKVTAPSSFLHSNLKITESGIRRKARSEKILEEKDIPFNKTLPVLAGEEDVRIRSIEDIVKRAIAICICAIKGESQGSGYDMEATKELINRIINQYGANDFFTAKEKTFINNYQPGNEYIQFAWGYESYLVMLWVLGFISDLDYPCNICDVQGIVKIFREHDSYNDFLSNSKLRNKSDILDATDLIYRYNWACVDARVNNREVPGGLDSGVVYERHRSLNWITTYMDQDWDNVQTHT